MFLVFLDYRRALSYEFFKYFLWIHWSGHVAFIFNSIGEKHCIYWLLYAKPCKKTYALEIIQFMMTHNTAMCCWIQISGICWMFSESIHENYCSRDFFCLSVYLAVALDNTGYAECFWEVVTTIYVCEYLMGGEWTRGSIFQVSPLCCAQNLGPRLLPGRPHPACHWGFALGFSSIWAIYPNQVCGALTEQGNIEPISVSYG